MKLVPHGKRKKEKHTGKWIAVLMLLSFLFGYGLQNTDKDAESSADTKTALPASAIMTLAPGAEAYSEPVMIQYPTFTEEPAARSTDQLIVQPTERPTTQPSKQPTAQPTTQPTTQPIGQPIAQLAEEQGVKVLFEGVTNHAVNVRMEASKDSSRVDQLEKGMWVQVLAVETIDGKDWYKIRYGREKRGFVFSGYVDRQITVTVLNRTLTVEEINEQILSGKQIPDSQVMADTLALEAATTVFEGSGVYSGALSEGKRSGQGTYVWENGDVYEGQWKDDRLSGQGVLTLADGTAYEGQFLRGAFKNGTIRKLQKNGAMLIRTVADGAIKKKACLEFDDGTTVEGNINKGEISGNVRICYSNGDLYEGSLEKGLKSGQGTYTWTDGAHYTGAWKNDKMNGKGTYYFSREERQYITGKFEDNQPAGIVTYVEGNGIKYATRWENGACVEIEYKRK